MKKETENRSVYARIEIRKELWDLVKIRSILDGIDTRAVVQKALEEYLNKPAKE